MSGRGMTNMLWSCALHEHSRGVFEPFTGQIPRVWRPVVKLTYHSRGQTTKI